MVTNISTRRYNMNRLNIFNPYKDKEINHEDVLTRNFLILVKNIPCVQTAFFELIKSKMPQIDLESRALGELSVTEVYTQINSNGLLKGINDCKILSIIISDDELNKDHVVQESSRNARYDGVIICDPSWLFIIENKPDVNNVWLGQLNPNDEDAKGNELISDPCRLSWRNIIYIFNLLLEDNQLSYSERILIEDFLEYVNEEYSWLNPYSNLSLCRNSKWLMDKRCGDILTKVFNSKELKYHKGWKYYIDSSDIDGIVREIALDYSDGFVTLWMYAGDTMVSSRELYKKVDVDEVKKLEKEGFCLRPNFHISFRGTGLVWFDTTKKDCIEYINYWKENKIEQVENIKLEGYYNELVKNGIIDNSDEILNRILSKKYVKLNICPGFYFGYKWPIEVAKKEDKDKFFVESVREKIIRIQSAYK